MIFTALTIIFSFVILTKPLKLTEDETIITMEFIKLLKIRHAILIEEDKNFISLRDLKNLSFNIPTAVKTVAELDGYITFADHEDFVDAKTIMLYKSQDLEDFNYFLTFCSLAKTLHRLCRFTWLIFSPMWMELEVVHVPYDCQFILVFPYNDFYPLYEVYNLKEQQHEDQWGTYDRRNGLIFPTEPVYTRRMDMNQTVFTGFSQDFDFRECSQPQKLRYRNCNYVRIVRDITENLNFKYESRLKHDDFDETDDLQELVMRYTMDMREHWYNLFEINITTAFFKYFPRNKLRWFIKYPEETHMADYYHRMFHKDLWYVIYFTVVVAGIIFVTIQFFHTYILKIHNKFNFGSLIFAACDAFMNQGAEVTDKASFRIAFLIIRLTVLFIFPYYCADLTSLLSTSKTELDFNNITEFLGRGGYRMLLPEETDLYITTYFEKYAGPIGKRISKKASVKYSTMSEALNLLCSDGHQKYALPVYVYPNVINNGSKCPVYRMKKPLADDHHFTFVLGMENYPSPYAKILNHKLLKLVEGGITQKIESMDSDDGSLHVYRKTFYPIELYQLYEILVFVASATTVIPSIILIFELIVGFFRRKCVKTENKTIFL